MKQELAKAIMTSVEALMQVPGTQLQTIEPTLRQLMTDLKNSNITPPAELDSLIEDAAVAHAEDIAYYNGICDGPYITNDMPEYYDNWAIRGVTHPNEEMRQELDELPF